MTVLSKFPDKVKKTSPLILVWDRSIRLFHWLLATVVVLLLVSGLSGNGESAPHVIGGILLSILLGWRWLWGFLGSSTARFAGFPLRMSQIRHFIRKRHSSAYGHNPLSAWMVVIMLFGLSLQALSGLMMAGLIYPGEWLLERLVPWLAVWHAWFPKLLLGMIAAHVAAAVLHSLKGDRVLKAMTDGQALLQPGTSAPTPVSYTHLTLPTTPYV